MVRCRVVESSCEGTARLREGPLMPLLGGACQVRRGRLVVWREALQLAALLEMIRNHRAELAHLVRGRVRVR